MDARIDLVADQQHLGLSEDVRQIGDGGRRIARSRLVARGGEVGVKDPDSRVNVGHERQIPPQHRSYDRNVDRTHVTPRCPRYRTYTAVPGWTPFTLGVPPMGAARPSKREPSYTDVQ